MPFQTAEIVSQLIDAAPDAVYEFARTMANLPRWASGLAAGVSEEDGRWFTESPMGRVEVAMAPRNPFRVLDHDVTLPDGTTVHNAFRVTPAGGGSLLTFVVLRLPGMTPDAFKQDIAHVAKDLGALKALLENEA
ncbi:MAG: SRPBCC family protein [Burkholderiaceae bacterium]